MPLAGRLSKGTAAEPQIGSGGRSPCWRANSIRVSVPMLKCWTQVIEVVAPGLGNLARFGIEASTGAFYWQRQFETTPKHRSMRSPGVANPAGDVAGARFNATGAYRLYFSDRSPALVSALFQSLNRAGNSATRALAISSNVSFRSMSSSTLRSTCESSLGTGTKL